MVTELNTRVMQTALGEKYITLFLGVYNKTSRQLRYVNCGHNPPVLGDSNGYTQQLKLGTIGLGMFEELPKVVEGRVDLEPDSILICFTDGLVETENIHKEEYGPERLEKVLLAFFKDGISVINDTIMQSLNDFKGEAPYNDDLAILSCRFY